MGRREGTWGGGRDENVRVVLRKCMYMCEVQGVWWSIGLMWYTCVKGGLEGQEQYQTLDQAALCFGSEQ